MSQTAALLGLAVPFEYRGVTYKVAPRDLEVEGLFALTLERRALQVIERHARVMGASAVEQRTAWVDACAAGRYDFPGPAAVEFMFSREGMQELAYLQLARLNPRVTRALVAEMYDAPAPEPVPPPEGQEPAESPTPQPTPWQRLWRAMEQATADFRRARAGRQAA